MPHSDTLGRFYLHLLPQSAHVLSVVVCFVSGLEMVLQLVQSNGEVVALVAVDEVLAFVRVMNTLQMAVQVTGLGE